MVGRFLERDGENFLLPVAHRLDLDLRAGRGLTDHELQPAAVFHRLAVELDDHVAAPQARLLCGTALGHATDQGATPLGHGEVLSQLWRHVLNAHAEVATLHFALFQDLLHHVACEIHGHGKAYALIASVAAEDGRANAHESAIGVHECAPGVAWVDRGVSLDEILVFLDAHATAAGGTDDPHRHRLTDAKGIADGEHHVADFDLVAIRECCGRQVLRFDLEDGDICLGVATHDLRGEVALVIEQRHLDLVSAVHDVVVGENVTVLADDDARAEAVLLFGAGLTAW